MLFAEDLIDDYTNGNLSAVREKLKVAPPLVAAMCCVDMYRFLMMERKPRQLGEFVKRLREWQRE